MMADLLTDLRDHLLREAAVLLQGDLTALPAIAAEKEALAVRLQAAKPRTTATEVAALRALAQRNARLNAAAQRGLASARDRLCDLQKLAAGLGTYAADGSRPPLRRSQGLNRRA
jgi:hypothetical protein